MNQIVPATIDEPINGGRSLKESAHDYLLERGDCEFVASRYAAQKAEIALAKWRLNPWMKSPLACSLDPTSYESTALSVQTRRNEVRDRIAKNKWLAPKKTDRHTLMLRIAASKGFRNLGEFAAALDQAGRKSGTLESLLTPGEQTQRALHNLSIASGLGKRYRGSVEAGA